MVFQQIQLSLFNMGNTFVIRLSLLHTHSILLCFLFFPFKYFFTVFSLFVNCKQTENVFWLSAYPLKVSCLIECLKVTQSVVVYYLSCSLEIETVKSLSIAIFCAGQHIFNIGFYVYYLNTFIFFTIYCSINSCSYE